MRAPKGRGAPIDFRRVSDWVRRFEGYRYLVSEEKIHLWLKQFKARDRDLAARVLDCVEFISTAQVAAAFRAVLASLDGWHIDPGRRRGKWRFVSFSTSPGESGDLMLWHFRTANRLGLRKYNNMFPYLRDLLSEGLTAEDTVVFVDDFSGTGSQVCDKWNSTIQELLPEGPHAFLVLAAATTKARDKIRDETDISVAPHQIFSSGNNLFSEECTHFQEDEKKTILAYCRRAEPGREMGFGDSGFVIVFAHRSPNNSIPILHAQNSRWQGVFPRPD
jgi:hypothetical protein